MSKINEIKVNITTIGYDSAKVKLNDIEEQQDRILYKQKLVGGMESNIVSPNIESRIKALEDRVYTVNLPQIHEEIKAGGIDFDRLKAEELDFWNKYRR